MDDLVGRLDELTAQLQHEAAEREQLEHLLAGERDAREQLATQLTESIYAVVQPLNASIDRVFAEKAGVSEVQEQLGLQAAEIKRLDQDSKDSANALRVVMETLEDTMPIEVRALAQPPNRTAALAPTASLADGSAARRTRTTC